MPDLKLFEVRDLRQTEWLWTSKALLFHSAVDGNTYKVYCGLAAYADNSSQQAYPSIDTLAKRLHMGRNTVMRALAKLEEATLIGVDRNTGEHNVYSLLKVEEDTAAKKPKAPKVEKPKAPKVEKPKAPAENWVKEILKWAEDRRGSKFVNYGRQVGPLGAMSKAGYTLEEVRACYLILEASDFWRQRGFDFKNVADELPKKIAQIRKTNGKEFEHLTRRA